MSHTGYIVAAWSAPVAAIAAYCAHLLWRGRRLTRLVPPGRRRWAGSDDTAPTPPTTHVPPTP